jgi:1-acyl-sn-glycerol-3-phosphate acyltransferase
MARLMRLSGQEYVDEYAAVVKLRLAGKPDVPQAAAEPLAAPVAAQGEFVQDEAAAPGSPASGSPVEEDDAGSQAAG